MPIISSPVPTTVSSGSSGPAIPTIPLVGITSVAVDQLKQKNVIYELKFFIKDNNGVWVDFSDKLGQGGVDCLKSHPTIVHTMESDFGVFSTNNVRLNLRNPESLFDDSGTRLSELKTVLGTSAAFSSTVKGQGGVLYRHEAKFEAFIRIDDGSVEIVPLGVFLIEDIITSTSGGATLTLVGKHKPLMELDAEKVKDGLDWHRYKPLRFLLPEIIRQYYTRSDDTSRPPADFAFEGVVEIQVPPDAAGNDQYTFSVYGRPPDNKVVTEDPLEILWQNVGKVCRALDHGAVGGTTRLWAACDDELWSFERATEGWRYHFTAASTIRYMKINNGNLYYLCYENEDFSSRLTPRDTDSTRHYGTWTGSGSPSEVQINALDMTSGRFCYRNGDIAADLTLGYRGSIGDENFLDSTVDFDTGELLGIPFDQIVHTTLYKRLAYSGTIGPVNRGLVSVDRQAGATEPKRDSFPTYNIDDKFSIPVPAGVYTSKPAGARIRAVSAVTLPATYSSTSYPALVQFTAVTPEGNVVLAELEITAANTSSFEVKTVATVSGHLVIDVVNDESATTDLTFSGDLVIETDRGDITFNSADGVSGNKFEDHTNVIVDALGQAWDHYSDRGGASVVDLDLFNTPFDELYWRTYGVSRPYETWDVKFTYGQFGCHAIAVTASPARGLSCHVANLYAQGSRTYPASITLETGYAYYITNLDGTGTNVLKGFGSDLRVGDGTGSPNLARTCLQPTCVKADDQASPAEFLICGIGWQEGNATVDPPASTAYCYRVKADGTPWIEENTTTLLSAGDDPAQVTINNQYTIPDDSVLIIDSGNPEEFQVLSSSTGVGTTIITLNRPPEHTHGIGVALKIMGITFRSSTTEVVTDVVSAPLDGTYDYITVECDRSKIGTVDHAYSVKAVIYSAAGHTAHTVKTFQGCPRGLARNVEGGTEKFYFIEAGANRMWSFTITGSNNFSVTLEDNGFQAVDGEGGLSSNLAFETIERVGYNDSNAVYGVSYPGVCEAGDLPYKPAGKYLLWKYDTFITDRTHLADFTGMSLWDAASTLSRAFDCIMGFSASGSFFHKIRPSDAGSLSLVTIESDIMETQIVSAIKNLGYKEIYNVASFTPHRTETAQPELNVTLVPRDSENPNMLHIGDFNLDIGDNRKRSVRLSCVRGGHIPPPHSGGDVLFRWLTFETVIESSFSEDVTAGQTTGLVIASLYGGDDNPDGVNTGDYLRVKSSDETKGFIERKLSNPDNDTRSFDIASSLGEAFSIGDPCTIVQSLDKQGTTRTRWSDEGVTTVASNATASRNVTVNSAVELPQGTYVMFERDDEVIDGGVVQETDFDTNIITLATEVTVQSGDLVLAYWTPQVGAFRQIGNTGVGLAVLKASSIDTDNDDLGSNPLFKSGDTIAIEVPGETLKADKQSKQVSYNATSIGKWGRKEYPHNRDNRFLHRRLALAMARILVDDYKDPHYSFSIQCDWKPFVAFLDTASTLSGITLKSPKLLPNAPENSASGYLRKIEHGPGVTKLEFRDVAAY